MKKILFSCIGTSDPVRNLRDGPWLHIMRHYRPEVVYVFLSAEMARIEHKDHRCEKTIQFIQNRWDDYRVEYVSIESDIEDASDMDLLDQPLTNAVLDLVKKYPEDQILLNLSSGTPQMDVILSLIATDEQYKNVYGIQVKNPEKRAGTSKRTNTNYNPEEQLNLNEDEEPGTPNRFLVPKLITLEKKKRREQIQTLIKHYNYGAILDMEESMPRELMALVRHLDARFHLDDKNAHSFGEVTGVPFPLYPCKQDAIDAESDYCEVVEYYLTLKNLTKMGRFTDYVLRLNPFIIRLQMTALNCYLGYPLSDITTKSKKGKLSFSSSKLGEKDPDLLAYMNKERGSLRDFNLSIFINNLILQHLDNVPPDIMNLFSVYGVLNEKRNIAAHQLADITDRQITETCGKNSHQLNQMIEKCIPLLYSQCNPAIFQIYERCNQYILEHYN